MRSEPEITCDGCGNDLAHTSNYSDWRLALINEQINNRGGSGTLMGAHPAIDQPAHFCGINCLRAWLDKHYPANGTYRDAKCWAEYQRQCRATGKPRQWL